MLNNKKLTVWILQTGEPLHIDVGNPRPMRAMNLANALVEAGHRVVLWSSAFNHQEKKHRCKVYKSIRVSPQLEVRLLPSPGYQRNIGLGRLWDHAILAKNLKLFLRKEKTCPDVAFIGYPPIEVAAVMTRWLAKRDVPTLLDLKDQWPDIFVESMPNSLKPLGRLIFSPYFYLAKRVMIDATGMSAMADSFLKWALTFAGRTRTNNDNIFPLTAPDDRVCDEQIEIARKWCDAKGILDDGTLRFLFVGSHSQAFDFHAVFEAAKHLAANGKNCEFIICGSGEKFVANQALSAGMSNVFLPGWVDRAQIEVLAERSYAALTPYRNTDNFTANMPNKVIDSLLLGLPILSPLQGEVANLIVTYNVGMRYGTESGRSLADCMTALIADPILRKVMSINALNLYRDKFSYRIVYGGLVKHLEILAQQNKK